ncbi:CDF family Co(II)/Ni(II) efflux transporter DmeF [Reyranella sp.]|jgi:cation diffusion facilitator family transporter|uniref:CDF family Co(II)/Ni(II) efflux transporter DmeF n=1 Tax=Reyranella sp. TaxID=1929291 RepID=UPI000BCD0B7F|nr:CDF family Co(II)/Ni(II) efflux transporter DmeF [Reyranella sp.]OYY45244.1 MAG: cation transporter [Rhodospirillales bacterium 35-66-84]OYZ95710.1 MAG: cation transporter [Rhodospirillales bacterium 24-66-33]OZB27228.1 MAG: cation transporter [Rhodospirillales bacterium 39-66-50]HQS18834.1 CDF family Co(II)/Ni(II) efflux transporter DmeF [Reyranella sp.]HQT12747.1 CDF family Co(II)/Ni(II) efflux transporter DmeF [Reyranella sp.]
MTTRNIEQPSHDHVFLGERHDENARRTLWVVGLTALMMVGEIAAGIVFNSMALLADGFHMATHAGALAVAAGAYAFARRHAADRRFSFGTGKVGDLSGFASALVLALVALGIAVESIGRLFDPSPVAFGEATLVAIVGLVVNVASVFLLSGGHSHGNHADDHHDHGHDHGHHDNNLRSAFAHVVADALTSVLAIVALVAGRYLGWVWLDPVMGIVGGIVIAVWAWNLLRDTAAVLLDTSDPHLEAEVREQVEGPGDARITDLHIWRIGPGAHAAIVSVAGTANRAAIRERLVPVHKLAHVTIETR